MLDPCAVIALRPGPGGAPPNYMFGRAAHLLPYGWTAIAKVNLVGQVTPMEGPRPSNEMVAEALNWLYEDLGSVRPEVLRAALEAELDGRPDANLDSLVLSTSVRVLFAEVYSWKGLDGIRGDMWNIAFSGRDGYGVLGLAQGLPRWFRGTLVRLSGTLEELLADMTSAEALDMPASVVVSSGREDVFEGVSGAVRETATVLAGDGGSLSDALATARALED